MQDDSASINRGFEPETGVVREPPPREAERPPIRCRNLTVGYRGDPVLRDVSFTVEPATTLAIVGRSGCGKTTLLRTLAGILDPLGGEATVLGSRLPRTPPRGDLGYIPQSLGLVMYGTVRRNVLHGTLADLGRVRSLLGRFPKPADRKARVAIEQVGLAGMEGRRVSDLSGGQRRRVAIARALVQEPRVLLADEILSELDQETARSIVDLVRRLQAETGMTVVIVEHDLDVACDIGDRLLRLDDCHEDCRDDCHEDCRDDWRSESTNHGAPTRNDD